MKNFKFILFGLFIFFSRSAFAQLDYPDCSPYSQFYSRDSIIVTCFGASTVQGIPAPLNFQAPLRRYLENCYSGKKIVISNYGISGQTTEQGLARFDAAISGKKGFLLILMGANDAVRIADGKGKVESTTGNIRLMVQKAKAAGLKVIIGTIQYFAERKDNKTDFMLARRRNRIVEQINNAFKFIASQENVRIADLNITLGKNLALYSDFVHPNQRGYDVMGYVWFDAINQEILQNFLSVGVLQNYPNPAINYTRIGYTIPSAAKVTISIYNMMGKKVATVLNDYRNASYHEEEINTADLPSGLYLITLDMLGEHFVKKMVVAK